MSYELGTKPDREAGPIERVVLQEDLGEDLDLSESEGSDPRSGRNTSASETAATASAADAATTITDGETMAAGSSVSAGGEGYRSMEAGLSGAMERARRNGANGRAGGGEGEGVVDGAGRARDEKGGWRGREEVRRPKPDWGMGGGFGVTTPVRGGGEWGSPVRSRSMTPRLSVDLINVDPVGEAVKHVSRGGKKQKVET